MVSIYFATKDKIYKAAGEEDRWTLETIEGPEEIRSIAFDEISNRLFAGTFNDGLLGSDDDGESWQRLGEDALNKRVMSIAVSKTEQLGEFSVIWAGTEPSMLYRSENGGMTWTESPALLDLPSEPEWSFPPRPETHHVRTIQPDLHDTYRIFVGIELGGVMRSLDSGASWEDRKPGSHHDSHSIKAHPFVRGRIYEAAGEGFAESMDGGDSWAKFNDGLGDYTYMVDVAADPGDADTMIASVAKGPYEAYMPERANTRLVRRTGGGDWTFIDEGLPAAGGSSVFALLTDSGQSGVFYAVNNLGIYISEDAGVSFEKVNIEWPDEVLESRVLDAVLVK
ncbi:WD40/YVTN/BNR-like repeat-containing protein [Salinicoccus sp. Marseille-QA3877]